MSSPPLCLFTCRSVSSGLKGHRLAPLTPWPPAASGPANIEAVIQGWPAGCPLTVWLGNSCTAPVDRPSSTLLPVFTFENDKISVERLVAEWFINWRLKVFNLKSKCLIFSNGSNWLYIQIYSLKGLLMFAIDTKADKLPWSGQESIKCLINSLYASVSYWLNGFNPVKNTFQKYWSEILCWLNVNKKGLVSVEALCILHDEPVSLVCDFCCAFFRHLSCGCLGCNWGNIIE